MVSAEGDDVNLVPLREAIEEHPEGSVIMFGRTGT
jgi:hypothetical protein